MMLVPALATALVYGFGGHLAIDKTLTVGTLLALATLLLRLLGPLQGLSNVRIDVMTALVSFERVFEVLDLPSQIQEKPDAVELPALGVEPGVRARLVHLPAGRRGLPGLARERRADRARPTTPRCSPTSRFVAEPGEMVALVGPSGAGKTTVTHLVARLYDVGSGAVRVGGVDVRDVTLQSLEDAVGYVTQDAHMFHDTIRDQPPLRAPGGRRGGGLGRVGGRAGGPPGARTARRARHRRRRPRLPPVRRRAAAAGDRPAAAQGTVDRGARRGDRAPRQRVRVRGAAGPRRGARGTHLAGDRPPALDGAQRRPDPGARRGPDRGVGHPPATCSPGAGSTPTSTAPSSCTTRRLPRLYGWTSA